MKKDKTNIIKNPKLRLLRNNLRKIMEEAQYRKFMELEKEITKLNHIMEYRDGKQPTPEEKEKSHKLSIERDRLENAFNRSIIYCQECKSTEKDMRYFTKWAEWVCVDCYDSLVKKWEHAEKLRKESEERGW